MKLETKIKLIHRIWLAVPIIVVVTIGVMLLDCWINSPPAAVETNTQFANEFWAVDHAIDNDTGAVILETFKRKLLGQLELIEIRVVSD